MHPAETSSTESPAGRQSQGRPAPVDDPRVYLAAERTFLAWVRTSLALMGFGFLIARFAFWIRQYAAIEVGHAEHPANPAISRGLGFGMIVVGVFVCLMAATRHRDYIGALRNGVANPPLKLGASLTIAVILALVGVVMSIQILLF